MEVIIILSPQAGLAREELVVEKNLIKGDLEEAELMDDLANQVKPGGLLCELCELDFIFMTFFRTPIF